MNASLDTTIHNASTESRPQLEFRKKSQLEFRKMSNAHSDKSINDSSVVTKGPNSVWVPKKK